MGHAKYIGRVAAMAVALGVGGTAATTPGIAWAGPTSSASDSSSTSPDSTTPAGDTTAPSTGITRPSNGGSDGESSTSNTTNTATTATHGTATPTTAISGGDTPQVTISAQTTDDTIEAGKGTNILDAEAFGTATLPTAKPEPPTGPTISPQPQRNADPIDDTASFRAGATLQTGPTATPAPSDVAAAALPALTNRNADTAIIATGEDVSAHVMFYEPGTAQQPTAVPTLDVAAPAPSPDPFSVLFAISGTVIAATVNVVVGFFEPIVGPGAPFENAALWGLLAWTRRQTNQAFANQAPTVTLQHVDLTLDRGQVSAPIDFGGVDPDGDAVTYSAPAAGQPGAPVNGAVTINQATGTWTYTPNPDWNGTSNLADTFTVTISDANSGQHLHGVAGLFAADGGHTTTRTVTVTVAPPDTAPTIRGGYAVHTFFQSDVDGYLQLAADGGATVIRDEALWALIESTKGVYDWSTSDTLMRAASENDLDVLLIVSTAPSWATGVEEGSVPNWFWAPPLDAADYGNFVGQVVNRYGTNGTFWADNSSLSPVAVDLELWNEPNASLFWGGQTPDPAKYVAMLKAGYQAAKAVDPGVTVVSAGLSPAGCYGDIDCDGSPDGGANGEITTGLDYLEDMYAYGAKDYFDALGWHPYIGMAGTASEMMACAYPCVSGWTQMSSTSEMSVRTLMEQAGDLSNKIWITETGFPTCTAGASYACISEAEQAELARLQAMSFGAQSWAGLFIWYDLQDDYGGDSLTDHEEHMGAVRADNTAKPVYSALESAFSGQAVET